jgi:hypothetical protein
MVAYLPYALVKNVILHTLSHEADDARNEGYSRSNSQNLSKKNLDALEFSTARSSVANSEHLRFHYSVCTQHACLVLNVY